MTWTVFMFKVYSDRLQNVIYLYIFLYIRTELSSMGGLDQLLSNPCWALSEIQTAEGRDVCCYCTRLHFYTALITACGHRQTCLFCCVVFTEAWLAPQTHVPHIHTQSLAPTLLWRSKSIYPGRHKLYQPVEWVTFFLTSWSLFLSFTAIGALRVITNRWGSLTVKHLFSHHFEWFTSFCFEGLNV